jgi:hypothetical protein
MQAVGELDELLAVAPRADRCDLERHGARP